MTLPLDVLNGFLDRFFISIMDSFPQWINKKPDKGQTRKKTLPTI